MYYLLAIIICGIVAVACVVLAIVSIIKKKMSLFTSSVIVFVIAAIVGVFSIFQYTVKAINYLKGDGVQASISSGAELAGKTAGSIISGGAKGLNTTLDDNAIAALAGKSATIMGKAIKASASGLDSTFKTPVFIDTTLANTGFEIGRAEEVSLTNSHDLGIFITFTKGFKGSLKLLMYDQEGKKMDIAETIINEKSGSEKVIRFSFPAQHDGITTYYILYKK